jgi:nitrogen fixation/metabolism regulation signal transduction histidine kinase
MALFFAWMAVLAAVLAAYCAVLWRKNRNRSRFRARLTILFLLFVLIPVIPLNLFVAQLITRSADMLLLPGVGGALETSLSALRQEIEEKGVRFLDRFPDPAAWSQGLLRSEGMLAAGRFRMHENGAVRDALVRLPECGMPAAWAPPAELLESASPGSPSSLMHDLAGRPVITLCGVVGAQSRAVVCYAVPERILEAKDRVSAALDVYSSLSLLKESILQRNLIWALAVLMILGLAALAVQVAKRLSRGITEPMDRLVGGMRQVAAGDFTVRIPARARDEFGFLIDSFNRMAEDLKTTKENLIRAEKLAAWQGVARHLSHEIKNSLMPVSISVRRLRNREEGDGRSMAEPLATIEEELRSLERMASDFSEFARLPEPDRRPLNLNDAVRSVLRLSQTAFGPAEIRTQLDDDLPEWPADPEQMRRLLNNLLKNAAEAAGEQGRIWVRTSASGTPATEIVLEVSDDGEGMDEETLRNAFTPYFTTKRKGTGLGLAVVEKIVKDHNGEIAIRSEKGKGTTVRIRFKTG